MVMAIHTHVATKLCWNVSSVFEGIHVELGANVDDESEEQPFVYHYKCDANNELVPGDGTDE
jgi:hypothetical protein